MAKIPPRSSHPLKPVRAVPSGARHRGSHNRTRARALLNAASELDESEAANLTKHEHDLEEDRRKHVTKTNTGNYAGESLGDDKPKVEEEERESPKRKDDPDDGERAKKAASQAEQRGYTEPNATARYFEHSPSDRMGDPDLSDPEEMKHFLGPSVRFAQHAMSLAERAYEEHRNRPLAISYLAELYLGLRDTAYANKALRSFGAATGIVDIYPLELIEHLLDQAPTFLEKIARACIFESEVPNPILLTAQEPHFVRLMKKHKLRGFGILGGAKPGYHIEPDIEPNQLRMTVNNPGEYIFLFSALGPEGWLHVDRRTVVVSAKPSFLVGGSESTL